VTPHYIPVKTPQGLDEMTTRHHGLSQRQRMVLFLVDGKRNVAEVQRMAAVAGASELLLHELLDLGLVTVREPVSDADSVWVNMPEVQEEFRVAQTDIPLNDSLLPSLPNQNPPVLHAVMHGHTALQQASLPDPLLQAQQPLNQAREILMRALMEQAPVKGLVTRMRLKRARSIEEVTGLIPEVEQHLNKPNRQLLTQQLLNNVKQLLILAGSHKKIL
jgi:hypothetical protein